MIKDRIEQVIKRAEDEEKVLLNHRPVDQIKQYLILSSPALEQYKSGFEREEKVEKQKPLSDYKNITEQEALKKIKSRNSSIKIER